MSYVYDAFGRRLSRIDSGVRVNFAWDGNNLSAVYDGSRLRTSYVTAEGPGEVLAEIDEQSTEVSFPVRDALGSVVAITNQNGELTRRIRYTAFGTPKISRADGTPVSLGTDGLAYRYTGHAHDPDGLVFARSRYYAPELGRFISPDPIWGANDYAYVGNQPYEWTDPSGCGPAAEYRALLGRGITWIKLAAKRCFPKGMSRGLAAEGIEEGIYVLISVLGDMYVGQSGDIPGRTSTHDRTNRLGGDIWRQYRMPVPGGKTAREIA